MEKYSDDVLNMKFEVEVLNGTKPERTFFSITEDSLRDVYHVLPSDTVEEARKKIMEVVSKDEFLYEYFHKDPRVWEIVSFEPGYWTGPAKEEKVLGKDDLLALGYNETEIGKMRLPVKNIEVLQTFQQKLTIKFAKRKLNNAMNDEKFFELYDKEFKDFLAKDNAYVQILKNKFNTKKPKSVKKELYNSDKLLVIPDVELHLGKLGSKFDSTDSYDYKKALYRYEKIIEEAVKVQDMVHAKEICMSIGNDYYNTDTEQNTTTAGTEQHNDTRFQQMIINGIYAHTWAIERMKEKCDKVIIKFNPGNHDFLIDYTLFMLLHTAYQNDPKVEIECKVKDSRWATGLVWNNNLIIFAHGKTPEGRALKDDDLALLKDTMFKKEAKGIDNVTVLAGHLHNASENNFSRRVKSSNGVTVLRNGSPSGDGAWDSGNMYSSDKSHQVYVFDAQRGLYMTTNIKLTPDELEKGITMPSITDETDYSEVVKKSINKSADDIVHDDLYKLIRDNNKEIKKIQRKYAKILFEISNAINVHEISKEQEENILSSMGYYVEIQPYLERQQTLEEALQEQNNRYVLSLKPNK